MGYIYKIENLINHQLYIGQTRTTPNGRYNQHKYTANHIEQQHGVSYLHRAMNKYGVENFSLQTIEEVDNNLLDEREQYWIKYYNTFAPNGYNLTQGGGGTVGFSRPQSEEEKLQKRKTMIQFYIDHPEKVEEARERTKQLWQDEEYRRKVTESNKKFYAEHPEINRGKNNPFYGKHHTEETKAKIKASSLHRYRKIAQLDKNSLEVIKIYDGVKEAERALKVSHGWLSKAATQDKVAYGYRWKFV